MNFNSQEDVRESDDIREELQPYVLSQYSASPTICKILKNFRNEIDPQADIELFFRKIFDIDTAEGIGLDIWGKIVGIERNIVGLDNETVYTLDDEHYRKLLMFKALANITDASLATLNKMLSILLGNASVIAKNRLVPSVLPNGDKYNAAPMHVRLTFREGVTELEKTLIVRGVELCLGAGVGWSMSFIGDGIFGFRGSGLQPFNQGVFIKGDDVIDDGGSSGGESQDYSVIITQSEHQTIYVVLTDGETTHTYTESFAVSGNQYSVTILVESTESGYLAGNLVINGIERATQQVGMRLRETLYISATEAEVGSVCYANGKNGYSSFLNNTWIFYSDPQFTNKINKGNLAGKLILLYTPQVTSGIYGGKNIFGSSDTTYDERCSYVTSIQQDITTEHMTSFYSTFAYCVSLVSVDLNSWNPVNVSTFERMFSHCTYLRIFGDISRWNTSSLQSTESMFAECDALLSADLSKWTTTSLLNVNYMFDGCDALEAIDISGWDTTHINSVSNMFRRCSSMKYVVMDSEDVKFSGNVTMPTPNNTCKYLVKDSMVDTYKAHANWSSRASKIESINNYNIVRINGQITVTPKEE